MYYLWNIRMGGWITPSWTYGTDRSQAKRFTEEEALAARKKNDQILPVPTFMMGV
jgi:hypothetical protein